MHSPVRNIAADIVGVTRIPPPATTFPAGYNFVKPESNGQKGRQS